MLNIVEFIKRHSNWEEMLVASPYFLKIKEKDGMVMFNYDQIKSDPTLEIVKEARGLVLEKGTWDVVRYGFRRFMNIGEIGCDDLDWDTVKATSKEDGTLIFIYYYKHWRVGTRNTFDADEAELQAVGYSSFRQLFDKAAAQYGFDIYKKGFLNKDYTYCLELCSLMNRVVVEYKEPKLFHILTRNNITLEEVQINIGIPKPKTYYLANQGEYQDLVNSFDETHEGIVLQDAQNHRAKLKSPLYFQLHKLAANHQINVEMVVNKIRTGEHTEFLAYFGEYTSLFERIEKEIADARNYAIDIAGQVAAWKAANSFATRKDFSDFVKTKEYSPIWYIAYDKDAEAWFDKLNDKKLIQLFKIGDDV